jgi:hypothetical protein
VPANHSNIKRIALDIRPPFTADSGPVGEWPRDPKEHFAKFIQPLLEGLINTTKGRLGIRRRTVINGLSASDLDRFFTFELFSGIVELPQEKQYFKTGEKPWCMS